MKNKQPTTLFEQIHRELNCYACEHADKTTLGKGPCCTRPEGIPLPAENGTCRGNKYNLTPEKLAWHLVHVRDTGKIIETKKIQSFESLGDLFLSLREDTRELNFCYALRIDGKQRLPENGSAPEGRLKGLIAWEIIGVGNSGGAE